MTCNRIGAVLLAAAILLSIMPAGAAAEHHPKSVLTLTLKARHAKDAVRLECRPAGGTHPHPRRACREIAAAHGDFDRLPGTPETVACTMEYRPVTATVRGTWRGERVRWQHTFPNPCTLRHDTGAVFDF